MLLACLIFLSSACWARALGAESLSFCLISDICLLLVLHAGRVGLCAMCGKVILDTKSYKQSAK
jgi:hypothetical protein